MGSLVILYHSDDLLDQSRYFRRIDFDDLFGPSDIEVSGYSYYCICRPCTFERLCSVPGRSFIPLKVE